GGHGPPWAWKDEWLAGCQSCVASTFEKRGSRRLTLSRMLAAPGTARAPPAQKSFCTSTTMRASAGPMGSMAGSLALASRLPRQPGERRVHAALGSIFEPHVAPIAELVQPGQEGSHGCLSGPRLVPPGRVGDLDVPDQRRTALRRRERIGAD